MRFGCIGRVVMRRIDFVATLEPKEAYSTLAGRPAARESALLNLASWPRACGIGFCSLPSGRTWFISEMGHQQPKVSSVPGGLGGAPDIPLTVQNGSG